MGPVTLAPGERSDDHHRHTGRGAQQPPSLAIAPFGDEELRLAGNQPHLWVLVPYYYDAGQLVSGYGTGTTRAELTEAFAALGLSWTWQPVTESDAEAVIGRIAAVCRHTPGLVVNLCDGCDEAESTGYPGSSVLALLEAQGLPFTGADYAFYRMSTSKIATKRALVQAGVPTPPYVCVDDGRDMAGTVDRLGAPLIVKPAISAACLGLTLASIVYTDGEIRRQADALLAGRHALICPPGTILVEKYVNGREFTVLVVGSSRPGHIRRLYPPLERVFRPEIPELERIQLPSVESEQDRYVNRPAEDGLVEPLCDIGRRAYEATGGTGYARIDIRMDRTTGELFVLEVNANCELSADPAETAAGRILSLAGVPFAELIRDLLCGAYGRGA